MVPTLDQGRVLSPGEARNCRGPGAFPLRVGSRICLDGGISTVAHDCCSNTEQQGVRVDVGYGDAGACARRTGVLEETHTSHSPPPASMVLASLGRFWPCADLSFISLAWYSALEKGLLLRAAEGGGAGHPVFEVGKGPASASGVVR